MQCASRRAISSDKAQGRVILQERELATPDAPEHKTAAAAGVDNSKKAVPEVETAQDCVIVVDFVDKGTRGPGAWEMRNKGCRIPIRRLREKCCRLAAQGDNYRYRNASCRLDLVGGCYRSCVSCLESQWTCGNSLRTWRNRHKILEKRVTRR